MKTTTLQVVIKYYHIFGGNWDPSIPTESAFEYTLRWHVMAAIKLLRRVLHRTMTSLKFIGTLEKELFITQYFHGNLVRYKSFTFMILHIYLSKSLSKSWFVFITRVIFIGTYAIKIV